VANKKREPLAPGLPAIEDFAGLITVVGRLVGDAVATRLRLQALREVALGDSEVKARYQERYQQLRSAKQEQMRDRLLLTNDAYQRLHFEEENTAAKRVRSASTTKKKISAKRKSSRRTQS
jgi:hypothetical protein